MTDLQFEFDQGNLREIENKLGHMKSEAPKALKDALNKTAKEGRKDLGAKAQQVYTVKTGGINSQMKIKNASTGNLTAVINVRGASTEMKKISYRGGSGGARLTTTINKNNGAKAWERGFRGNIAKKGQKRKKKTSKGDVGSAVTHIALAAREGKARLPIKPLYTLSVPSMIGNQKDVYNAVEPKIQSNLEKNVDEQIKKILAR